MIKKKTFGDDLKHFVRSIDIVDNDVKNDVLELIKDYLKSSLNIHLIVFHVETRVNNTVGLHTTDWLPAPDKLSVNIKDENNKYTAQVAMVYDTENPSWIHGANGEELSQEENYIDKWSNADPELIPVYVKKTSNKTLTSIIIPVRNSQLSKVIGVINYESDSFIEHSNTVKSELERIANSIATLYMLNSTFMRQRENTKKEITYLRKRSQEDVDILKMISKPRVFVACSSNAEQDVMGHIIDVLDKLKEKGTLDYTNWKDMAQPGVIINHIADEIRNCLFGVCYFSDPTENDGYFDNPNVLFESGLVSAKCSDSTFESLVPVREKSSNLPPFDLAGIRLLEVPRNKEGRLNIDSFKGDLEERINALLEQSGIE